MILSRVQKLAKRKVLVDVADVKGGTAGKELHDQVILRDFWLILLVLPVYFSQKILSSEPANQDGRTLGGRMH